MHDYTVFNDADVADNEVAAGQLSDVSAADDQTLQLFVYLLLQPAEL